MPDIPKIKDYIALAMQIPCLAINKYDTKAEVREVIDGRINTISRQIFGAKKFIGPSLRLIVLPEYFLTGFPTRENIEQWRDKACFSKDDEIFTRLGDICQREGIFLSGNYYETDDNFPDFYFQASFIIDPSGKMILNYRRLNSMFSPTPHDVLDKYVEIYGYESLFPVVDTELGKLACIASEEILYPEVARCLMMRGAEVFLHSSSEIASATLSKKNIGKRARALENMAYVISANSAAMIDSLVLSNSTDGHSQIVHYDGHILAEALVGESVVANAYIHIEALREYRSRVSMKNYIARQRFELYAPSYSQHSFYPANQFHDEVLPKSAFNGIQQQTIDKLKEDGILG